MSATVNGAVYNATVTVPSIPSMESYVTFNIQVENALGTSATINENYISSNNNIFVDTISPSIELIGSADYVIPYGTSNPFIPNVTVSDGDPNYIANFTLVKNATVNNYTGNTGKLCHSGKWFPRQVSSKVDKISAVCHKCDSYVFALICKII